MPVAFVITRTEEDIVNAVSEGDPKPHMDGSLFKFRGEDVKEFIEKVGNFMVGLDVKSDDYRAGLRLIERLGAWIGVRTVERKEAIRDENPVDTPEVEEVPIRTRRRRVERSVV